MKFLPANRLISLDAIKTESPFALSRRYPSRCNIFCHIGKHYPPIIAHTGSCARPKPSRCLRSPYTAGLCRLSPVSAGRWPFPTLSPQVFPQVLGPLPRWDPMVHMPVSSHRTSAFPVLQASRLPHLIRTATSVRDFYEAAVIPLCSGPKVCSPPRSLLPQSPRTGQP